MNNYFEKFPTISYANNVVNNIITKIQISKTSLKDTRLYHPYTLREGERADVLAQNYYGDSRYSWMIYLVNNIVDPYFQWPMNDQEFSSFINKKYGSMEKAIKNIAFYRVEYEQDDRMFTPSEYSTLPAPLKKYWSPIYNNETTIGYERSHLYEARETNRTIYIDVDDVSLFAVGDIVTSNLVTTQITLDTTNDIVLDETISQGDATGIIFWNYTTDSYPKIVSLKNVSGVFNANTTNAISNSIGSATILNVDTTTIVSEGTIKAITGNTLIVQHITGKFSSDFNYLNYESNNSSDNLTTELSQVLLSDSTGVLYIKGTDISSYIVDVINDVVDSSGNSINATIPDKEYIYWAPVDSYKYESELNESRKFIYLIDKSYLNKVEKEISQLI